MSKVIPAILVKSEEEYAKNLKIAENVTDLVQVDLVDGKFAKNLTILPDVILDHPTNARLEIQVMVEDTIKFIKELVKCPWIFRIVIPIEVKRSIFESMYLIKKNNKQVGLSLNMQTNAIQLEKYANDIDLVLILGVNPGFSGQKLNPVIFEKIHFIKTAHPNLAIEVDGGINFTNAEKIARSGVNFLAVNSALFKAQNFRFAFETLAKRVSVFNN